MLHRHALISVAVTVAVIGALLLCSCGGGSYDGARGACVVDGTRSCVDDTSADSCRTYLHGDHFYETRRCKDLGFPQ